MRLIDADALKRKAWTLFDQNDVVDVDDIDEAPTIEPPVVQWISVKERLPERSERALAFSPAMKGSGAEIQISRGFMLHSKRTDITNWMPLPEPPREETQ